jgi:dihydrofolate reductase
MRISLFVAADENELIGRDGALPWSLSEDLQRFRRLTTGHTMVAGRVTQDSIVARLGHPLPGRTTVVVTRNPSTQDTDDVLYRPDVATALATATEREAARGGDEVFVIGGTAIYRAALPYVRRVYLTRVAGTYEGDTWLDRDWLDGFRQVGRDPSAEPDRYTFLIYERV